MISTLNSAYAPVYDGVGGEECRDRTYGAVGIVPAAPTNTLNFTLSTVLGPAQQRVMSHSTSQLNIMREIALGVLGLHLLPE